MKAGGQKAGQGLEASARKKGIRGMEEEGNENLNQGNILLALKAEAKEERAKDERGEVEGGKKR